MRVDNVTVWAMGLADIALSICQPLVNGRTLRLHDCDDSTRAFYVKECGRSLAEMAAQNLAEDEPRPPAPAPPHNGFGRGAIENATIDPC